ncbi:MAG: protein translocase subunit SecF [Deltaproteobacteria bacterium]|nr:protein translocase subunit SecF [Deltaproteobacteria bacterium]
MELIKPGTTIDFVGKRFSAMAFSGVLILASLATLAWRGGPNYGVDFSGGTVMHVRFAAPPAIGDVRGALASVEFGDVTIQDFGSPGEFLVRLPLSGVETGAASKPVADALAAKFGAGQVEVLRVESVGPRVGKDLRQKAILAVVASTIMMGIYLWLRFQLRFGIGAAVALIHDVTITVGALALLNYEFDLTIVAALLTVVGFSVNDTVIVSDRIRENMRKSRRESLASIVNSSINETLSRTILTTGTAVLVILALFFLGGSVIHGFAYALLVGFLVGTYSSIFVASPVVLAFETGARGRSSKR